MFFHPLSSTCQFCSLSIVLAITMSQTCAAFLRVDQQLSNKKYDVVVLLLPPTPLRLQHEKHRISCPFRFKDDDRQEIDRADGRRGLLWAFKPWKKVDTVSLTNDSLNKNGLDEKIPAPSGEGAVNEYVSNFDGHDHWAFRHSNANKTHARSIDKTDPSNNIHSNDEGDTIASESSRNKALELVPEIKQVASISDLLTDTSSFEFLNIQAFLRIVKNVGGNTSTAAEGLLKQVTVRLEELFNTNASADLASFVHWASEIASSSYNSNSISNNYHIRTTTTKSNLVDDTREFATRLLSVTNGLLSKGYVNGDPWAGKEETILRDMHSSSAGDTTGKYKVVQQQDAPKALFHTFDSAVELNDWSQDVENTFKMAQMASIIYYEETVAITKLLAQGESLVAMGTTSNVKWTVTDSLVPKSDSTRQGKPRLVRTVTIRGFDASDERVDRQALFFTICCAAKPTLLRPNKKSSDKLLVHSGLYHLAQDIYADLKHLLVDWLSHTDTQIVLVGHSIGGALSSLVLFLMTLDKGADFVKQRVHKVYTFGAPPVVALESSRTCDPQRGLLKLIPEDDEEEEFLQRYRCNVLSAFGLPSDLVHGFVQPWDPVPRLFTAMDPLYPVIGEIDMENGDDGMVLWPRGPPRTLRYVTSAIIEAWGEGWPQFRDEFRKNCNQTYTSVGVQHLFLPEPTRYLTDRFIGVDVSVPSVQTILRLSSSELYPALAKAFPLDTFEISYVPQAIRSFVHHFYPAYSASLVDYTTRLRREEAQRILSNLGASEVAEDDEKSGLDDDRPCFSLDIDNNAAEAEILPTAFRQEYSLSDAPGSTTMTKTALAGTREKLDIANQAKGTQKRSVVRTLRRAADWLWRNRNVAP